MSLMSQIGTFDRKSLRKSETKVQTCEGKSYVEKLDPASGNYSKVGESEVSHGFVVDTKPDLQVAQIGSCLFLGSQDVAADLELLQNHEITHIVNAATGIANSFPDKFTYCNLELLDVPETDIIPVFERTYQFMQSALNSFGRIFVHCNAGVSRAPTIVAAFLMQSEGLDATAALERIKSVRPAISPNRGFIRQLHEYNKILQGRDS